jgi:basic membrane protein A
MRKIITAAAGAALTLALASGAQAADKLKACWVYTGPVGDFGYSYQHDQGRLFAAKALGDKVDATTFLENVPENDSERSIEQEIPEGEVRARHRLQARAERLDLCGAVL